MGKLVEVVGKVMDLEGGVCFCPASWGRTLDFGGRKANGCFYLGSWCEGSWDDGLGESG